MIKREARARETIVEQREREAPIAPLGSQINYSEMVLTQARSAPTNMGWKSVLVTLIIALSCVGVTSLVYMLRVPSEDVFKAALVSSYMREGGRLYEAGRYVEAIMEYDKALASRTDYDLAYYRRGRAYEAKGDKERASADYRKVLEISTDEVMQQAATARLQELAVASP